MRILILIAVVVLSLLLAGCITEEKKPQEVKFFGDIATSLGAAGNGTQFQGLSWRVNISNIGGKTAQNTRARIILHPEIVSRLNNSDIDQVDTGPHAITQLRRGGPLTYLMDRYFDYIPAFVDYGNYFIRTERGLRDVPTTLAGYLTLDILPGKDRLTILFYACILELKDS